MIHSVQATCISKLEHRHLQHELYRQTFSFFKQVEPSLEIENLSRIFRISFEITELLENFP